jgi:predicted anti-sigma-YlaC factor YlaD
MEENKTRAACRGQEALLEDFLAGKLSGSETEQLTAHLQSCAACRGALEDARQSTLLLRESLLAMQDPGTFFATRVMALIRAEEGRRALAGAIWRPLETLSWRLALTAAMALAFLVGYGVRSNLSQSPEVQMTRQPEAQEIFSEPIRQPLDRDAMLMAIAERNHER